MNGDEDGQQAAWWRSWRLAVVAPLALTACGDKDKPAAVRWVGSPGASAPAAGPVRGCAGDSADEDSLCDPHCHPGHRQEGRPGQHRDRCQGRRRRGQDRRAARRQGQGRRRGRCAEDGSAWVPGKPLKNGTRYVATVTAVDAGRADQDGDQLVHHDGEGRASRPARGCTCSTANVRRGDAGGGRVHPGYPEEGRPGRRTEADVREDRPAAAGRLALDLERHPGLLPGAGVLEAGHQAHRADRRWRAADRRRPVRRRQDRTRDRQDRPQLRDEGRQLDQEDDGRRRTARRSARCRSAWARRARRRPAARWW